MPSIIILRAMQGPLSGTLASMLLYGVICMQVFHYASNYASSDRPALKWLVGVMWVLESIHTFLSVHFIEYYLILHFDDPGAPSHVVWTMGATYISGFIVACVVDLFLVWRIWKLSNQPLLSIFLGLLATVRTAVGIGNAALGFKFTKVVEFLAKVHPTMVAGWTLSAFADSLIAAALCYYLHKQRSGMERTDRVINTLLAYTLNTGALTSLFAILVIVTFLTLDGMAFTAFVQVQSKLYAISLLASLNARRSHGRNINGNLPSICRCTEARTPNVPQDQFSGPVSVGFARLARFQWSFTGSLTYRQQATIQIRCEVDVEIHRQLGTTLSIPIKKLDVTYA